MARVAGEPLSRLRIELASCARVRKYAVADNLDRNTRFGRYEFSKPASPEEKRKMPGDLFQINFVCVIISLDNFFLTRITLFKFYTSKLSYHSRAIEGIGTVWFARIKNKIVIICNTIRGFLNLTFNYLAGRGNLRARLKSVARSRGL